MFSEGIHGDVRFFQTMLGFCVRHLPGRAPEVMRAAIAAEVPISTDHVLFCTFLSACQRAKPALVDDALDVFAKCGPRQHNAVFGIAHICREAHRPSEALFLVGELQSVEVSDRLLSILAACCAEARSERGADAAEKLLELIREKNMQVHQATFGNLAKALLSQRRFDAALNVLYVTEGVGMIPSVQVYTHVASSLAKANLVVPAMNVLRTMIERGVDVGPALLSCVVVACGRADDLPSIQYLHRIALEKFILQNPIIVSAFVSAYGRCAQAASVQALEQYARDHTLLNDDVLICSFVCAYDHCNDMASAERMFLSRRTHDLGTLNSMIASYARNGKLDKAVAIADQVVKSGLQLSIEAYTNILSVFSKADRAADGMDVFRSMQQRGMTAGAPVFATLVSACGRARNVDAVRELHRYAREKYLMLNGIVLSSLIFAYGRCRDLTVVRELHQFASDSSLLESDDVITCSLISAYDYCDSIGDAEEAFTKRCEWSVPRPETFNTIMAAYSHHGMLQNAIGTFERFKTMGVPLDAEIYTSGLSAYVKADRLADAMSLFESSVQADVDVGVYVLRSLIQLAGRQGDLEAMKALRDYAAGKDLLTDVVVAEALITTYAKAGCIDDAMAVFQSMVDHNVNVSVPVLVSLLDHVKQPASITKLLDYARSHDLHNVDDVVVAGIDAYERADDLAGAEQVFRDRCNNDQQVLNIRVFDEMIEAYARRGMLLPAMDVLEQVKASGVRPTGTTLTSLLSACRLAGDVVAAEAIAKEFADTWQVNLNPAQVHILAGVYTQAGRLDEALQAVSNASNVGVSTWMSVLEACCKFNDVDKAERALSVISSLSDTTPDGLAQANALVAAMYTRTGRTPSSVVAADR
ncbi:hypothetical protein PBRA_006474 [Plasmodiophora brassicae]|nr:hypothetical protein PBRA_006474 [Plasmodiophora brassicae]